MKNIAIIPARGNSKRLPGKNIIPLANLPLIAHSIKYAQQQDEVDEIYVTTDDRDIKETALYFGAKVIDRPPHISGDHEPTVSALKHVLQSINYDVENVIVLQPTNPLRPKNLLHEAMNLFNSKNRDSLFTVSQNRHKLGKINSEQFEPYNYEFGQRSQDLEPLYFENGLLYISKAELILDNKIISKKAYPFIINHIFANVDIDTQDDLEYAEYLIQKYN